MRKIERLTLGARKVGNVVCYEGKCSNLGKYGKFYFCEIIITIINAKNNIQNHRFMSHKMPIQVRVSFEDYRKELKYWDT